MLSWFDIVCLILATVERESNVLEKELEPEFTYTTNVVMLGSAQLFLNCKAGTDAASFAAVVLSVAFLLGSCEGIVRVSHRAVCVWIRRGCFVASFRAVCLIRRLMMFPVLGLLDYCLL